MRLRLPALLVVFLALAGCLVLGVARANTADTAISGTITKLADGTPLQGALVTVAGSHQPPITETTGADGSFSIEPTGDGPYGVGVSASGYKSRAIAGVSVGSLDPIALEPANYTPLPVYAGLADMVVADARSGIFYAIMKDTHEVYRTLDYGGTWQLTFPGNDDSDTSLTKSGGSAAIAVSGVSGEVAVAALRTDTAGKQVLTVSFSIDYGLTWREWSGASCHDDCPEQSFRMYNLRLFWGHASAVAPDVLVAVQKSADGSWNVWRADMSAASPEFTKESSDPFGQGFEIAVADSTSGSFVGRLSASGALSFAPLSASAPIEFGADEVTGLPGPPLLLRLGGSKETAAPPDGALIVGGSGSSKAVMITKAAGAASFSGASLSAATDLPDTDPNSCAVARLQSGSVTPTTTATSGAGNAGICWLQKSGTGALTVTPRFADGRDWSYDADYGQPGNLVSIMPSTTQEPMKWATLDPGGVPVFNPSKIAGAGTDPDSGGVAIAGITSPIVNDTAYGPAGGELAVAAETVTMASKDGGKTMTEVFPGGRTHRAVQWWQGASGEWLLFGGYCSGYGMLGALRNWDGNSTLSENNVSGSTCTDLGGPAEGYWGTGVFQVTTLAPVPGTDTVFIGLETWGEDKYGSGNHLYRARITATDPPALADVVKLDPNPATATLYSPSAMAYCPASSASEPMRDVLFVATGHQTSDPSPNGALLRITGATTGSPSVAVVGSIPHDVAGTSLVDVRADCERGVVYTGIYAGQSGGGLYKSVDGGQTFAAVTIEDVGGATRRGITAIGLNPADPNDVTVAFGNDGNVYQSADGGASWILVHDSTTERASRVNDIEFAPGASSPTILGTAAVRRATAVRSAAAAAHKLALVGTSSGAFTGDLAATSGLIGVSATTGSPPGAGVRITTLGSDGHPSAAVVPATGATSAVFHRLDGLYLTSATGGSWSIPSAIPGTRGTDDFPAAVLDGAGRLHVAFARTGVDPGIYVASQGTNGSWSSPLRVSALSGATLPALTVTGSKLHVAFLRTAGSPGIYETTNASGAWTPAAKLPGTSADDALPARGGPSLQADAQNRLHLAFARANRQAGIYLALKTSSGWSAPEQLTSAAGDGHPSLVLDSTGEEQIAYTSPLNPAGGGLYELRHSGSSWADAKIPGTLSTDIEPVLAGSGQALALAFVRPAGAGGVYSDSRTDTGSWAVAPERLSANAKDRSPAVAGANRDAVQIVFERHLSVSTPPRTLGVLSAGGGKGTVTSVPAGISCGRTCSHDFANGSSVTLSASAQTGSVFAGWSGGGCSGTGSCKVTVSGNRAVTATFAIVTHSLTVSKSGAGTGTVTSSPAGINCGSTCAHAFNSGTSVTLKAVPAAGSIFTGWSGGGCSGTDSCKVTVSGNATITATFNSIPRNLTASKSGAGTGTVTSSPAGINCGSTCVHAFSSGTSVTLTATPATGSVFTGWSGGGCSGSGSCVLTLKADTTVTATFNLIHQPKTTKKPPQTKITKAKINSKKRTATFKFAGSAGSKPYSFQCKLDKKKYSPCRSGKTYKNLKPGKHTFQVKAKDHAGMVDKTPAIKKFKIKR